MVGKPGSTKYTYAVIARDSKGNASIPGPAKTVAGPDVLNNDSFIRISWDACDGAETYWILRNGKRIDVDYRPEGRVKIFEDKGQAVVNYSPPAGNRTADAIINGMVVARSGVSTPGVCQPTQLRADVNDYSPAGLADAATLALSASRPVRVTGLAAAPATEGRWLLLVNTGSAAVTLVDRDKGSKPENTFRTGTGRDFVLAPDAAAQLVYTLGHWRFLI